MEIPCIIDGKEARSGTTGTCVLPHDHGNVIGRYHKAGEKEVRDAVEAALKGGALWSSFSWEERASVFLKAADLLAGPRRQRINGACMLSQSKKAFQAEIDTACELIDFFRFNIYYAMQLLEEQQPMYSSPNLWNRVEYRALEGFVFAVTPFNFASIAGNLPSAPAIMGNTVLWKPASNAVYTAYQIMLLFQEAGLPDGVINFIPGDGSTVGPIVLDSPDLSGVHFTGSTATFQNIWQTNGNNIKTYRTYPRIVGETVGKDFIFAHPSARIDELGTALIRGAYEYQGKKCCAASRAYIPKSLWKDLSEFLISRLDNIETTDPTYKTMEEEIFGPVLTVYVYDEDNFEQTLHLCNETSPYGLTEAVFSVDRGAIEVAGRILRHAAGNFYINDKPTGAVVGQQPFGGEQGQRDKRQGGEYPEHYAVDNAEDDKGEFRSSPGLSLSVYE